MRLWSTETLEFTDSDPYQRRRCRRKNKVSLYKRVAKRRRRAKLKKAQKKHLKELEKLK